MIPLVLAALGGAARADDSGATTVVSETAAAVRHDFFGQAFVPFWETLQVDSRVGSTAVHGYVGLEAPMGGVSDLDPDVYALTAEGSGGGLRWTLGRQQVITQRRLQSLDGARVVWAAGDAVQVEAWGGLARHQDLDDLSDGIGVARVAAGWRGGPASVKVGGWLEAEEHPLYHADVEARYRPAGSRQRPDLRALLSGTWPAGVVDRARVEFSFAPHPQATLTALAGHRESPDPDGMLGEAVLDAFAPDGVDEAGLRLRLADARWSALSTGYHLSTYVAAGERRYGHTVQAAWMPGRTDLPVDLSPGYRFQSGPGGAYHALFLTARYALSDATGLWARGAVVPYRKLHDPWDTALDGAVGLRQAVGERVEVRGEVELARDALFEREVRGGLVARVEVP